MRREEEANSVRNWDNKVIYNPEILAPCGIYCGACPSLGKTCLGCASQEMGGVQKRKSKWGCKLRVCCYKEKGLEFCSDCLEFPCDKHRKKLMDSHPKDPRFQYRRDVAENLILIKELGEQRYLEDMKEKYTCPHCGGQVVWYDYRCRGCGEEVFI